MPPLDPLLIGSFPTPPSHIPTSPVNPPPSRPPSLPLPPVPGPSRISTTESLYLLSTSSSSGSRSRSSSKVSDGSSVDNARSSSRPVSPASIRSHRAMTPHAGIEFLIQEHNARNDELLNVDFEVQLHDDMDPEELLSHRTSPIHLRRAHHSRAANDSISSIDVSDILAATSNLSDDEYHAHIARAIHDNSTLLKTPQHSLSRKQSTIARHRADSCVSLADPIDPSNMAPSTPTTLFFPSTSSPTSPLRIIGKPIKENKNEPQKIPTPPSSPDIPSILASSTKTRPSRQQERTRVASNASSTSLGYSNRARSQSRQRERVSSTTSNGSSINSTSAYAGISAAGTRGPSRQGNQQAAAGLVPRRLKGSLSSSESGPTDRRSWIPHDDYGRPIPIPLTDSPVPVSRPNSGETEWSEQSGLGLETRIEVEVETLEDENDSGSDSSIDLHTPLPRYMLKHGLLSPKSKLLAEVDELRNGRESVMSAASSRTGYSNDPRNTEKRRIRHKDGKLLRGGIGLTTGLGWSDSEDEDAPSALTRRLSTLNLSRSTSFASLHSMRSNASLKSSRSLYGKLSRKMHHNPHSLSQSSSASAPSQQMLSKSYSSGMLYDGPQEPMPPSLDELDEWGVIDAARFSTTTSNSLTPQADGFGTSTSPSSPSALSTPGFPRSLTMPNIKSRTKTGPSNLPPSSFSRKRSGSGSRSEPGSRLSTSSMNSTLSGASRLSASTSFSGFSRGHGIPEEDLEEDDLGMKTTTSVGGTTKYRAHTVSGRNGYKYSKTPSGGSGSISMAISASKMSHSNSTSTSGSASSGAHGLSSSPSTSSSMSIPLPVTPCDEATFDEAATVDTSSSTTLPGVDSRIAIPAANKNKTLPPLPPTLRRIPGKKELHLDASDTFMSTPVSGAHMAAKEDLARPKGLGLSGSLNSKTRAGLNASSGIATPVGRKTPIQGAGARATTNSSTPSAMSTPRPLRLASSNVNTTPTPANSGGSRDRAPVPVPSVHSAASSGLPKPSASSTARSIGPQSAPAASTSFRPNASTSSGSSIPSALTPGERKPRTGTGMVYRTTSVGPSKLRLPAVAAASGNISTSGIARPARSTGPVAF